MAVPTNSDSYYAILEIEETADGATVLASYRRLAKLRHPDKSPDNPEATAEFQKLQEAYSVLKDPESRARYDRFFLRQPTIDTPRKRRRAPFTFFAFDIRRAHQQGLHQQERHVPPPASDPLEREIRDLRRQINEDELALERAKAQDEQRAREIERLWAKIHTREDLLVRTEDELSFLLREVGTASWFRTVYASTAGTDGAEGADAVETQDTSDLCWAEARKGELASKQQDLQGALKRLRQQLETHRTSLQASVTAMNAMTRRKADKEETLRARCKVWRAREIHGGAATAETDNWNGWNGWCGWDPQEKESDWDAEKQWWDTSDSQPVEGGTSLSGEADDNKKDQEAHQDEECEEHEKESHSGLGGGYESGDELIDLEEHTAASAAYDSDSTQCGSGDDEHEQHEDQEQEEQEEHEKHKDAPEVDTFNVDLLDLEGDDGDDNNDGDKMDLPSPEPKNVWWPGTEKVAEATREWEKREREWRQASWQASWQEW